MEDKKWSEKMEGDDGVRTLECLRGRLLAERQASRLAKENAEFMGTKLIELEKQIREESKLRKKAEKKLKFLMKKLESLQILPNLEESEKSTSLSENSEVSCRSSTSSSGPKHFQEHEPKMSLNLDHNVSVPTASNQGHGSPPIEENSNSPGSSNSHSNNSTLTDDSHENSSNKCSLSSEDPKTSEHSSSNLNLPRVKMEMSIGNEFDREDSVGNSLAVVPVSFPATSQPFDSKISISYESIGEVLDALRHAREKLQSSMGRSLMIKVGPT